MNILKQYEGKIKGKLSTFDRLLIKGYFTSFWNPSNRSYFLWDNQILYKDFGSYAEGITKSLNEHRIYRQITYNKTRNMVR